MVLVKTGGIGSAVANRTYPAVDGLIAGTTTQEGHEEHLVAEEEDLLTNEESKGLYGSR